MTRELGNEAFDTPETAALAEWPVSAKARVLAVDYKDSQCAEVTVDTDPSHRVIVRCELGDGGWVAVEDWSA